MMSSTLTLQLTAVKPTWVLSTPPVCIDSVPELPLHAQHPHWMLTQCVKWSLPHLATPKHTLLLLQPAASQYVEHPAFPLPHFLFHSALGSPRACLCFQTTSRIGPFLNISAAATPAPVWTICNSFPCGLCFYLSGRTHSQHRNQRNLLKGSQIIFLLYSTPYSGPHHTQNKSQSLCKCP